jgi:hypothetical protein
MKSTSPEMIAQCRYVVILPLVSWPLAFGDFRVLMPE